MKEGLLAVVSRLQELHGSELKAAVSSSCMFNTLSVLLNDSQATTRQLAVSTIANLYPVYREELVVSYFSHTHQILYILASYLFVFVCVVTGIVGCDGSL